MGLTTKTDTKLNFGRAKERPTRLLYAKYMWITIKTRLLNNGTLYTYGAPDHFELDGIRIVKRNYWQLHECFGQ